MSGAFQASLLKKVSEEKEIESVEIRDEGI